MNDKFKCDRCGDTGHIFRGNLCGTHVSKCPDCQPMLLAATPLEDYFIAMAWQVFSRVHDGPNGPYLDEKSAVQVVEQIHHAGFLAAQEKCERAVNKLNRWGVRITDEDKPQDTSNWPHPADLTFLEKDVLAAIKAVKEGG
jgi:hypothetical protein